MSISNGSYLISHHLTQSLLETNLSWLNGGTASAALAVAAADNNDGDPMAKVYGAHPTQLFVSVVDLPGLAHTKRARPRPNPPQVMPLHYIIQREMVDHGLHTGKLSHYEVDADSDSTAARRRAARRLVARYHRHKPKGVAAMLAEAEKA
jgi:hypothetical protein